MVYKLPVQVKEITPKIIHLKFPNRYWMASSLMRFQEYYESPQFKGKVFSHEEFEDWYAQNQSKRKNFTYYADWLGFNIPSYVLTPFSEGKFDPLRGKEKAILNIFVGRSHPFYIIGTFQSKGGTLYHEIAHGLFYTVPEYREKALEIIDKVHCPSLEEYLKKKGYDESVFKDEMHAYISESLPYLKSHKVDVQGLEPAHRQLKTLYEEYLKKEQA